MKTASALWTTVLIVAVLGVAAADTLVGVYVDGRKHNFDPAARVRAGTAYAPLRAATEAMGATVQWLPARQMAVVCKQDRCVNIPKAQGIIVNGRLLIPLRLMAEALQVQVAWDTTRKAVLIGKQSPLRQ